MENTLVLVTQSTHTHISDAKTVGEVDILDLGTSIAAVMDVPRPLADIWAAAVACGQAHADGATVIRWGDDTHPRCLCCGEIATDVDVVSRQPVCDACREPVMSPDGTVWCPECDALAPCATCGTDRIVPSPRPDRRWEWRSCECDDCAQ
jgi:hypothetical protein